MSARQPLVPIRPLGPPPTGAIRAPLALRPRILAKVWGGQRLGAIFEKDPSVRPGAGEAIGEAWLAWEGSVVEGGPHAGRTVGELVRLAPEDVLGRDVVAFGDAQPRFPSLVKLLDTSAWLSVQVHPDDEYARRVEGEPFGKTEMWYVLAADEASQIIHGLRDRMGQRELQAAIRGGRLLEHVRYLPVAAGDVIFNPAGTIHALGRGILLYEVQQASDLTYRLYDWDRSGMRLNRPLHIDKALDVARRHPEPEPSRPRPPLPVGQGGALDTEGAGKRMAGTPDEDSRAMERRILCACPYFAAEEIRSTQAVAGDTGGRSFQVLTLLGGRAELVWGEDNPGQIRYPAGGDRQSMGERVAPAGRLVLAAPATVLIPAAVGHYQLRPIEPDSGAGMWILSAYVPAPAVAHPGSQHPAYPSPARGEG